MIIMPEKDYAIIYNPTSAAGKSKLQFEQACSYLEKLNVSYKLFESEYATHVIKLSEELAKEGYRVIGAGGDGTCNEVLNGVINSNTNALVGFIPMGSGNDIPGAVGIIPDVKRACEVIAENNTGKCDIGLSINSQDEKRYFLGIGSQGFDAEVTKRTNDAEKKHEGTKNYTVNVLKTLFGFKLRNIRVTMDNDIYEGKANLVAVGNGPSYGGWMYICPSAQVHDGKFHITVIDNMGRIKLLINFNKMYSKSLMPHPNVLEYESKKLKIEMVDPSDEPYIGQVDGEIIGKLPINYEILPDGYEFIKPKENEVLKWFEAKYCK
jgi:diacylglycerol kinase (ATP)